MRDLERRDEGASGESTHAMGQLARQLCRRAPLHSMLVARDVLLFDMPGAVSGAHREDLMLDAYKTTGSSPPLRITLTRVRLVPGCTIAYGYGVDGDGAEVTFVGDWRPLAHLGELLASGERIEVILHDYQIIAWRRP